MRYKNWKMYTPCRSRGQRAGLRLSFHFTGPEYQARSVRAVGRLDEIGHELGRCARRPMTAFQMECLIQRTPHRGASADAHTRFSASTLARVQHAAERAAHLPRDSPHIWSTAAARVQHSPKNFITPSHSFSSARIPAIFGRGRRDNCAGNGVPPCGRSRAACPRDNQPIA